MRGLLLCGSQIVNLRQAALRRRFHGACLCKTGWVSIRLGSALLNAGLGARMRDGGLAAPWPLAPARPPLRGRSPSVAQPSASRQEKSDQKTDLGKISFWIPSMSWVY